MGLGRWVVGWLPAVLMLLVVAQQAPAQTRPGLVSFQRLAIPDEVPAHLTTALAQDRSGFLWMGTQDGLVRYDGYSFKAFRPKPDDPTTLGGSYVRSLLVARDGRLWVGSFSGGLSVYDPASNRFTRYRHQANQSNSLAHDRVEGIAEAPDGQLWLATDEGLDRLDPASGQFRHYLHKDGDTRSLADNQVRGLLLDRAGKLWVGTRAGLQLWQGESQGFARVASAEGVADSLAGQYVTKLYQDSRGQIWIGTMEHGAAVLDPASGQLRRLPPVAAKGGVSHFWIYGFAEVGQGELWIATFGGGIDVVDPQSLQVLDRLHYDGALTSSIGSDRVGAVLTDRSGLVWVGSWGGGLARHDPGSRAFVKLRHSPGNVEGLSHPSVVRAMEMQDGTLWLGTNGNGIDVFSADGHLLKGLRPDAANPGALADGSITCLAQAADGTAWVGTLNGTLHRLKPGQAQFERFDAAQGLPGGPIRSMAFAPDGALWLGSASGLARVDAASDAITAYTHTSEDGGTLSGRAVEALAFMPDGRLWVGTENGLNLFDTASGKAQRIYREPGRADSLPDNWVPDLMVAADGRLWLATQAGAATLTGWDGRVAHFDVLSQRLGLPAGPVESLLQDAQGQVWLGARLRLDPASGRFKRYGPADGNEFRTVYIASRARMRDGGLLFGSPEGLLLVRPDKLADWTYQPPVAASSIRIDGQEQHVAAGDTNHLVLQPRQHDLRVEFAALDFSAPQKLVYRYRLHGFDADWTTVDATQRFAVYTQLPPGDYRLEVQGSNRAGQWSATPWQASLTVLPAFYQTLWFRGLLVLLALAGVYAVFRLRLRQLRLRSEALEQTVSERTADLAQAYQRIEEASLTDPLTQLHNRRFLEQTIQADLDLVQRRHSGAADGAAMAPLDPDLVFMILDLDHFKQVNDQHGHAAGDAVLTQTAAVLRHGMRASDYVVRWGGEEFLLVARFIPRGEAAALAEKIRAAVEAHSFELPDGQRILKTCSIGFAAYPFLSQAPGAVSLDLLLRLADAALYAAKRSRRNAWVGLLPGDALTAGNAEQAVQRGLADVAAAIAAGELRAVAAPTLADALVWR
jgi:diguanylate cyclase (GGDEF)-like protein